MFEIPPHRVWVEKRESEKEKEHERDKSRDKGRKNNPRFEDARPS
jgi:hypothetical protein